MNSKLLRLARLCLERNIPFVIYRLPGEQGRVVIRIQRSGRMLFLEDPGGIAAKAGFVYAPFHRSTNFPVVFFEPELVVEGDHLEDSLLEEVGSLKPLYPDQEENIPAETTWQEYEMQARKILDSFGPDLSKVVLSKVKVVSRPASFHPADLFLSLASAYPGAFVHLIHIPGAGTWMGATPEVLFRSGAGKAMTTALAGTRKLEEGPDRAWGEKELEEQHLVSVHIEEVLRAAGISDFSKHGPQTVTAGNVQHLATRYSFSPGPADLDVMAFLKRLHPTPAVSGLPVAPAIGLIRETERHNREYYAGFCGPMDLDGRTDLFVNLRCMKVLPHALVIYSGGGFTAQSVIRDEWQETEWKAKTLLNLI